MNVAHAAMEVFLVMDDMEISACVDEQERFMLSLAAGEVAGSSRRMVAFNRNEIGRRELPPNPALKRMFVILVGAKGSGKSHIGRILEARLGVHFFHVEPLWLA